MAANKVGMHSLEPGKVDRSDLGIGNDHEVEIAHARIEATGHR
jgi:hypothetical protein